MESKRTIPPDSCCPSLERPVEDRPLLTQEEATELVSLFKVFAGETRLRLLHALLRSGEACVGELAKVLAMKPQAVSNQLQRLADRGMLSSRRNGKKIYYRITDPCISILLDRGLCLIELDRAKRRRPELSVS